MEPFQKNQFKSPSESTDLRVYVLVVDDDKVNQFVISKHLNKWGFQAMIASNGHEALELIKSKLFQIVLMDLNMPEIDGREVTKRIRAMEDPYFKTVPILAFSAIVDSKEKATALGMTDYASKPLNAVELQSKIIRYLMETTVEIEPRKLSVDFELYTDGDEEFKHELISLMIHNLLELADSIQNAVDQNNQEVFHKTVHKVMPTIGMLNDHEFSNILETLKGTLNNIACQEQRDQFHRLCKAIIRGLEEEMETDTGELVPAKAA